MNFILYGLSIIGQNTWKIMRPKLKRRGHVALSYILLPFIRNPLPSIFLPCAINQAWTHVFQWRAYKHGCPCLSFRNNFAFRSDSQFLVQRLSSSIRQYGNLPLDDFDFLTNQDPVDRQRRGSIHFRGSSRPIPLQVVPQSCFLRRLGECASSLSAGRWERLSFQ